MLPTLSISLVTGEESHQPVQKLRPSAVGCGSLKDSLMKDMVFISQRKVVTEKMVWITQPVPPTPTPMALALLSQSKDSQGKSRM